VPGRRAESLKLALVANGSGPRRRSIAFVPLFRSTRNSRPTVLAASSGVEDTLLRGRKLDVGLIVVLADLGDSRFRSSRTDSATIDDDSVPVPRDAGLHIECRTSLWVDPFS
jgi:hypothetical protein